MAHQPALVRLEEIRQAPLERQGIAIYDDVLERSSIAAEGERGLNTAALVLAAVYQTLRLIFSSPDPFSGCGSPIGFLPVA